MFPVDAGQPLNSQPCFLREGGNHTIYVNRAAKKVSAVPRHREIIEFTAGKICRDLDMPRP